jgi:hypothetical protein
MVGKADMLVALPKFFRFAPHQHSLTRTKAQETKRCGLAPPLPMR